MITKNFIPQEVIVETLNRFQEDETTLLEYKKAKFRICRKESLTDDDISLFSQNYDGQEYFFCFV